MMHARRRNKSAEPNSYISKENFPADYFESIVLESNPSVLKWTRQATALPFGTGEEVATGNTPEASKERK